jgi:hypothetical protein
LIAGQSLCLPSHFLLHHRVGSNNDAVVAVAAAAVVVVAGQGWVDLWSMPRFDRVSKTGSKR